MAGVAPGRRGQKLAKTDVARAPYWVPWDNVDEVTGVPQGRVRLLPAGGSHQTQLKETQRIEGHDPIVTSTPYYQAKQMVPLWMPGVPDEALRAFVETFDREVERARKEGREPASWTGRWKHLADRGREVAAAAEVKVGAAK